MTRVPSPHRTRTTLLILFVVFCLAIGAAALLDVERTIVGTCLLDPARRWTMTELRPGSFVSRADDLVAGQPLQYRLYQFDRPAFVDIELSAFNAACTSEIEVDAGQLVATVHSSALEIELAERATALQDAQTELEVLQAGAKPEELDRARIAVELARTELRTHQSQYGRQQQLHEQGILSAEDWEITSARHDLLRLDVALAEAQLRAAAAGGPPEEITRAETTIAALSQELAALENMLAAAQIRTPVAGNLRLQNGASPLLTVVDTDTMVARILVPQRLGFLARPGLRIRTYLPGLTTGPITGQLVRVDRRVVVTAAGPFLAVYGLVANPDGVLTEGMQGNTRIYCGKTRLLRRIWDDIVTVLRQEIWPV